jgi:DNA integrity scanning protein DisA with diadenylate cyclase activity
VESEIEVRQDRGMRHRSAARYTWDHHHTVAVVVSEEGSVTIFRYGEPVRIGATAGGESLGR